MGSLKLGASAIGCVCRRWQALCTSGYGYVIMFYFKWMTGLVDCIVVVEFRTKTCVSRIIIG